MNAIEMQPRLICLQAPPMNPSLRAMPTACRELLGARTFAVALGAMLRQELEEPRLAVSGASNCAWRKSPGRGKMASAVVMALFKTPSTAAIDRSACLSLPVDHRPRQAEIFPQRCALVVVREKSAALQFWDDECNEILIAPRHARRADNEAVTGGRREPFFKRVGDLSWSTDPGRRQLAATRDGDEIARRWLCVSQCGDDAVPPGLGAGEPGELGVTERLVERL